MDASRAKEEGNLQTRTNNHKMTFLVKFIVWYARTSKQATQRLLMTTVSTVRLHANWALYVGLG